MMQKVISLAICCWLMTSAAGQYTADVHLVTDEANSYYGSLIFSNFDNELLNEISKTDYQNQSFITIYTEKPDAAQLPLLGKFTYVNNVLYFTPRFPFLEGRTYWVQINLSNSLVLKEIQIPKITVMMSPIVTAIYPSTEMWPANQLKFYICFNQPMRFGEAYKNIRLLNENGETIEAPFLELEHELWNADQTRLTVWFDPGRIKTMLIPNQERGTPLEPGKQYQITISKNWLGTNGLNMQEDFNKTFTTLPPDHTQPAPEDWKIQAPEAGTAAPLTIIFPEPMDYALLLSGIGILDEKGQPVPGKIKVTNEEQTWHFFPGNNWKSSKYTIRISSDLEDLAGNNLSRTFDTKYQGKPDTHLVEQAFVDLQFIIR